MTKILLLGSQHGNELLGEVLYTHIRKNRSELLSFVTYKTANLRAKKYGTRFMESDLNRSYNGMKNTYEERRALRLLRYIKQNAFDLVLDLHTTTCKQPPCLIVPSINNDITQFIRATSISDVVHMDHAIVASSLIGVCSKAVSIEFNKDFLTEKTIDELCDDLQRYLDKNDAYAAKTIYQIGDLLAKTELTESQAKSLVNFQKSSFGFYPVLVGENSYKKQTAYLGFKAYNVHRYKV
jgi:succinylglutamate desuccinylase